MTEIQIPPTSSTPVPGPSWANIENALSATPDGLVASSESVASAFLTFEDVLPATVPDGVTIDQVGLRGVAGWAGDIPGIHQVRATPYLDGVPIPGSALLWDSSVDGVALLPKTAAFDAGAISLDVLRVLASRFKVSIFGDGGGPGLEALLDSVALDVTYTAVAPPPYVPPAGTAPFDRFLDPAAHGITPQDVHDYYAYFNPGNPASCVGSLMSRAAGLALTGNLPKARLYVEAAALFGDAAEASGTYQDLKVSLGL